MPLGIVLFLNDNYKGKSMTIKQAISYQVRSICHHLRHSIFFTFLSRN
jgi:hypothetical protein